jgi:hypothetical protein
LYHRKAADTRIASRFWHRQRDGPLTGQGRWIAEKPLFVQQFDSAPPVVDQIGTLASEEDHVRGNFAEQEPLWVSF